MHSNIVVYLDKQGLDLSMYRLRVIIKTERKNLSFYILASKLKNDLWLVGFPMTEYSHKYQCNQM